jgi:hypothetical protein
LPGGREVESGSPTGAAQRYSPVVREHAGLVGTGLYLAATCIGMLSSWTFYQEFDINVFHYAQVSDFLLAAVRMPLATLAILFAVPVVWLIVGLDDWLSARARWYRRIYVTDALWRFARGPTAMVLYFVGYAFLFSLFYSDWLSQRMRTGRGTHVSVQLQAGAHAGRDLTRSFEATLLGTTGAFVFLYDDATGASTVVPLENLALLAPRSPSRSGR